MLLRYIWTKVDVVIRAFSNVTFYDQLRYLRLALCGAVAGAALVGTGSYFFGVQEKEVYDLLGAVLGFVTVAAAKMLHFA